MFGPDYNDLLDQYLRGTALLPPSATDTSFLGWFERPKNTITGALAGALDPNDTLLSGAWKGLSGQSSKSFADVFGVDRPSGEQDWPEWLLRTAAHEIPDLILDPLNLVGGIGKAAKAGQLGSAGLRAAGAWNDAAKYLGGSAFGKAFAHSPWGMTDQVMPTVRQISREAGIRGDEGIKTLAKVAPTIDDLGAGIDLYQALERPGTALSKSIDPGLLKSLQDVQGLINSGFKRENMLRAKLGMPEIPSAAEEGYNYVGRIRQKGGIFDTPKMPAGKLSSADPEGREIFRLVAPDGKSIITKLDSENLARNAISWDPATNSFTRDVGGVKVPLEKKQASLKEILDSGIMGKEPGFVENPADAMAMSLGKQTQRLSFLNLMDDQLGKTVWRTEDIPTGLKVRQIRAPGLEGLWAEPTMANFLENQYGVRFADDSLGATSKAVKSLFEDTVPGRALNEITGAWKTFTLAGHPGFHVANEASNLGLLYESGLSPAAIAASGVDAVKAMTKGTNTIVPGLKGADLVHEMSVRGVLNSLSGDEIASRAAQAMDPKGPVGEAVRKFHDFGFGIGQKLEEHARMTAVIDYLKKNATGFATMPDEQKARVLDDAGAFAEKALLNYSKEGMTQFENETMRRLIPFYGWTRGITGRTAELAAESPERIHRLGQMIGAVGTPLTPEQQQYADPWVKEGLPVTSMFGVPLSTEEGKPGMAQLARFIPQGSLEQLKSRPLDYLLGQVNPFLKMPYELLANRSTFKDRPIDPIAGGGIASLYNPIIGEPYSKATEYTLGAQLPAGWDYMLSQLPGGRYVQELNTLGRGLGLINDPYKEQQSFQKSVINYATGQKVYAFDEMRAIHNRNVEWEKRQSSIKSALKLAATKGDAEGAAYYTDLLRRQAISRPYYGTGG